MQLHSICSQLEPLSCARSLIWNQKKVYLIFSPKRKRLNADSISDCPKNHRSSHRSKLQCHGSSTHLMISCFANTLLPNTPCQFANPICNRYHNSVYASILRLSYSDFQQDATVMEAETALTLGLSFTAATLSLGWFRSFAQFLASISLG